MTAFDSDLIRRAGDVPENLRFCLEDSDLIRCVYEAIHEVSWPKVALDQAPEEDNTPNAVLRTLLVYSYAIGMYSARDIEAAAIHDPTASYLAVGYRPKWTTLRAFRRKSTIALRQALIALFRIAAGPGRSFDPEITYAEYSCARFQFQDPIHFEMESEKRLKRAIQADSMASDD